MYKILSLILFGQLVLIQAPSAQSEFEFNISSAISSEEITSINDSLNTPLRMALLFDEEYLVVSDINNFPPIHIMKVIDSGDLEYVKGIGREGRGPSEYLSPNVVIPVDGNKFYIHDAGNLKLVPYNREFEALTMEEFNFMTSAPPTSIHKSDEGFYVSGITVEGKFEVIDEEGNLTRKVGEEVSLGNGVPPNVNAHAWHSYSTYSPVNNRIAVFSRAADLVELFDMATDEKVGVFANSDFSTPDVSLSNTGGMPRLTPNRGAKTTFLWATSNDEYIYALYSGKLATHDISNFGKYVMKFDWDLNFIGSYELDHQSFSIELDKQGNLYSIQLDPLPAIRYIEMD